MLGKSTQQTIGKGKAKVKLIKLVTLVAIAILLLVISCTSPAEITTVPEETTPTLPPTVVLQEGNNLPQIKFQSIESTGLEDNRIGTHWSGMWSISQWFVPLLNGEILDVGLKRVCFAVNNFD